MKKIIQTVHNINTVPKLQTTLQNIVDALNVLQTQKQLSISPDAIYTCPVEDIGAPLKLQLQEETLTDGSIVYNLLIGRDTRTAQEIVLTESDRKTKQVTRVRKYRKVKCDQCNIVAINGVACHELGCPNAK